MESQQLGASCGLQRIELTSCGWPVEPVSRNNSLNSASAEQSKDGAPGSDAAEFIWANKTARKRARRGSGCTQAIHMGDQIYQCVSGRPSLLPGECARYHWTANDDLDGCNRVGTRRRCSCQCRYKTNEHRLSSRNVPRSLRTNDFCGALQAQRTPVSYICL